MRTLSPLIQRVATLTGENRERLLALAWRESLCGWALDVPGSPVGWGDSRHGFGPFQIDRRYHSDFVIKELGRHAWSLLFGPEYTVERQALYACNLLRDARSWFKLQAAISLTGDALERAIYASYNAGPASVAKALRNGQDPDSVTTGKNYSASIFAMAQRLSDPGYANLWSATG